MSKCRTPGKRRYKTFEQAQIAATKLAAHRKREDNAIVTFLRAYKCACGAHHVGGSKVIDWSRVK